jgi:hypothetical protein
VVVPSFGEELRRERELRQIGLREIAEATKINLRYLEALETNDFEHLPGGVFNRGFVRAYAEFIGVDPEAMVNAYLLESRAQEPPSPLAPPPPHARPAAEITNYVPTSPASRRRRRGGRARSTLLLLALAGVGGVGTWAVLRSRGAVERPPELDSPAPARRAAVRPESPAAADASTPWGESRVLDGRPPLGIVLHVDRPTSGRLNCDDRRIEVLDGIRAGARLELSCTQFLVIDATDAGALRIGLDGGIAVTPGADGQRLTGYRIEAARPAALGRGEP